MLATHGLLAAILPEASTPPAFFAALSTGVTEFVAINPMLNAYFSRQIDGGFTGRQLLYLSALLYPIREATAQVEQRLRALKLSRYAIKHVKRTLAGCTDPTLITATQLLSRREIYRYFAPLDEAGIDAIFIANAAGLAADAPVEQLWAAWFEQHADLIAPPSVINGQDLLAMGIAPGEQLGDLLAQVREEQAAGTIADREGAIAFIGRQLDR